MGGCWPLAQVGKRLGSEFAVVWAQSLFPERYWGKVSVLSSLGGRVVG